MDYEKIERELLYNKRKREPKSQNKDSMLYSGPFDDRMYNTSGKFRHYEDTYIDTKRRSCKLEDPESEINLRVTSKFFKKDSSQRDLLSSKDMKNSSKNEDFIDNDQIEDLVLERKKDLIVSKLKSQVDDLENAKKDYYQKNLKSITTEKENDLLKHQ